MPVLASEYITKFWMNCQRAWLWPTEILFCRLWMIVGRITFLVHIQIKALQTGWAWFDPWHLLSVQYVLHSAPPSVLPVTRCLFVKMPVHIQPSPGSYHCVLSLDFLICKHDDAKICSLVRLQVLTTASIKVTDCIQGCCGVWCSSKFN
jgi:hypothetical protein